MFLNDLSLWKAIQILQDFDVGIFATVVGMYMASLLFYAYNQIFQVYVVQRFSKMGILSFRYKKRGFHVLVDRI